MVQLRRIWDDFIAEATRTDVQARGSHEDENRSVLRLYDDRMVALYTPPIDEICPATAVGHLSFQRINHRAVPIANIYAKADQADDGVSRWRLVQLQPNFIRVNKENPARPRPTVTLDELEAWLIDRAEGRLGPADFAVISDVALTVQTLVDLFVNEATTG